MERVLRMAKKDTVANMTTTENERGGFDAQVKTEQSSAMNINYERQTASVTFGFKAPIPGVNYSNMEVSVTIHGDNVGEVIESAKQAAIIQFGDIKYLFENYSLDDIIGMYSEEEGN